AGDRRLDLQRPEDALGILDVERRFRALLPRDGDVGLRSDAFALDLLIELAHVRFCVRDREDVLLGFEAGAQLVALNLEARALQRLPGFRELALRRGDTPPLFGFGPLDL